MTLTYNRAELIERLVAAIHTAKAREEDRAKKAAQAFEDQKAKWNAQHTAEWLAALPKIRARLKRGAPIRPEDLPQSRERYFNDTRPALFTETYRVRDITAPRELATLLAAVRTIENESITPTQLSTAITPAKFRDAMSTLGYYEGMTQ
jgi:hypothetical protein